MQNGSAIYQITTEYTKIRGFGMQAYRLAAGLPDDIYQNEKDYTWRKQDIRNGHIIFQKLHDVQN
jgi:hypothetical protein